MINMNFNKNNFPLFSFVKINNKKYNRNRLHVKHFLVKIRIFFYLFLLAIEMSYIHIKCGVLLKIDCLYRKEITRRQTCNEIRDDINDTIGE